MILKGTSACIWRLRTDSAPPHVMARGNRGDSMLSTTSVLLAIALILPPAVSNAPSAPTWETLPAERPLSALAMEGYVDHDGARIWYGTAGKGEPVILLHGGMESSLCWGNQVPALIKTHHR